VRVFLPQSLTSAYYRPDEKYMSTPTYKKNVDVNFQMPHGDLVAMNPFTTAKLREPRVVRFKTDFYGLRNDNDYGGQKVILSGDSFVAGTGNDQKSILVNSLKQFGVNAYSIAMPDNPQAYLLMIRAFLKNLEKDVSVLIFIFEGNDFIGIEERDDLPNFYDKLKLQYLKKIQPLLKAPNYIFSMSRQVTNRLLKAENKIVRIYKIGNQEVGFYDHYIEYAGSDSIKFVIGNASAEIMKRIKGVFFVPTKYRVYHEMIQDIKRPKVTNPAKGYLELVKFFSNFNIPVIDLSIPLKQEAHALIKEDKYVYWRDDTHWNEYGIRVAALEVSKFIKKYKLN
jgi:hypothetical protein